MGPVREQTLGWIAMVYVFIFFYLFIFLNATFSRKKNPVNLRKYILSLKVQSDMFCSNPGELHLSNRQIIK